MQVRPQRVRLSGATTLVFLALCAASPLQAQNVKPPKVQLWLDLSTGTMAGMPEMDMGNPIGGLLGGLMGGGARGGAMGGAPTTYGMARGMGISPPRLLDIALYNRLKPGQEASQAIPAGMLMGASLPLLPLKPTPPGTHESEPGDTPPDLERPRGRVLIYWGCGDTVRPGQPLVINLATAQASDFGTAFAGRYVPDRSARVGPGHAVYPNERNTVTLKRDSSLQGEHQVTGDGIPANVRFSLGAQQDLLPAIDLSTSGTLSQAMQLRWTPLAQARAYYLHAMGKTGEDMVLWSSAETRDSGMGLFDYLPNATVDRWIKDKLLLPADTQQCAVPAGIFQGSEGAMARMIAYGHESHLAHPPRPADPKAPWEPDWAVRVRVKSQTMAMLGESTGGGSPAARAGERGDTGTPASPAPAAPALPNPLNMLRGLLGR